MSFRPQYIKTIADKVAPHLQLLGGSMLPQCDFLGHERITMYGPKNKPSEIKTFKTLVIDQFRSVKRNWSIMIVLFYKDPNGTAKQYSVFEPEPFYGTSRDLDAKASEYFLTEITKEQNTSYVSWGYLCVPSDKIEFDEDSEKNLVDWFSARGAYDREHCENLKVLRNLKHKKIG